MTLQALPTAVYQRMTKPQVRPPSINAHSLPIQMDSLHQSQKPLAFTYSEISDNPVRKYSALNNCRQIGMAVVYFVMESAKWEDALATVAWCNKVPIRK